jgi:hypothetical protein
VSLDETLQSSSHDYTYLAAMLVTAPVIVFLGFREDRTTGPDDCALSAWPFIWPFVCPLRLPLSVALDADFLGFFARPLAWAAMFAGAVTADCGPSAAARVWDCLAVTCGFAQYDCFDVSKQQAKEDSVCDAQILAVKEKRRH